MYARAQKLAVGSKHDHAYVLSSHLNFDLNFELVSGVRVTRPAQACARYQARPPKPSTF